MSGLHEPAFPVSKPQMIKNVKTVTIIGPEKAYERMESPRTVVLQPNGWLYVEAKAGYFLLVPPQRVVSVYGEKS